MTLNVEDMSRVQHLAHRLEQDIQRRGFRVGDKYITAEAAGQMLDVSRMTANRAMNVLARRKVLVRCRSRGTFIGPAADLLPAVDVKTVHFITFVDDASELYLQVGAMLAGLQTAIPQVSLQSHCMPLQGALACVQREVEAARSNPSFGGFVLSLGTRQVQQYLAQSGLPTVVHGSVYAGISLPCVESDQDSVGRIMVRQALAAGHRRMVWVNRELWRRGDEVAFDGMLDEVHAAGLERVQLRFATHRWSRTTCRWRFKVGSTNWSRRSPCCVESRTVRRWCCGRRCGDTCECPRTSSWCATIRAWIP